jgi:hypothetical protein
MHKTAIKLASALAAVCAALTMSVTAASAAPPPPVVTSVSLAAGVAGTTVTVEGANLAGATSVDVGKVSVPFTDVAGVITVGVLPLQIHGLISVQVTTPAGISLGTSETGALGAQLQLWPFGGTDSPLWSL